MGGYLKTMEEYFCGKHAIFETKNNACVNATYILENKTQSCDASQVAFESEFCLWRQALTDLCESSRACYDAAVAAYTAREAAIRPLVESWKAEYTGLKKILCYVDIWLSDNDVTTVDKPQVGICDQLQVDTSPMDIAFPLVPPLVGCDKSPVSKYPGSGMFSEEYVNVPLVKAPTACPMPSEMPPTTMPPTMPPFPGESVDDPWAAPGGDDPWAAPGDPFSEMPTGDPTQPTFPPDVGPKD
jgi:hypothetical protein